MANSTGLITSSGIAVKSNISAVIYGVQSFGGSTATTITVYHGTAATNGNEILIHAFAGNTGTSQITVFKNPITSNDGVYVTVTGTSASTLLSYDLA